MGCYIWEWQRVGRQTWLSKPRLLDSQWGRGSIMTLGKLFNVHIIVPSHQGV